MRGGLPGRSHFPGIKVQILSLCQIESPPIKAGIFVLDKESFSILCKRTQVAACVSLRAPMFFRGVTISFLRLPRRAPALIAATITKIFQGANLEQIKYNDL
jgi:hypothetical protein